MFRKKRSKKEKKGAAGQLSDKVANRIAHGIVGLQQAFANRMNGATQHISTRTWKVLIIVFALAWGSLSLHFVVSACTEKDVHYKSSKTQFIVMPGRNDSLVIIEKIYEQQKKLQQQKNNQ